MKIFITSAIGEGKTDLAAFDQALIHAGIANTNLIYLSSIMPKNPKLIIGEPLITEEEFGKRLYVVMSKNTANKKGQKISAGIGWVTEKQNRFGMFVEHIGKTKKEVNRLIKYSLEDMIKNRNEFSFSDINMKVEETTCNENYACALACAVYKLEDW